jgi:hypothetical protein
MVKEIMTDIDALSVKYGITDDDCTSIRLKVRKWSYSLVDKWHGFLANVVDAKFAKKKYEESA